MVSYLMRIGILTFHSQLNYGGVLQCWALQNALTRILGEIGKVENDELNADEVFIVDRWLTPDNSLLDGPFGHAGFKGWCVIALKTLMGCGTWKQVLRHWRTRRFVRSLNLTPYHFYNWSELSDRPQPLDLKLDLLVVGSDQVWHGGDWGDPRPYLLEGAPELTAITYAASFGMKTLPSEIDYTNGFKRFAAISVRESEGVALVESQGAKATHVVDPTLLLDSAGWSKIGEWKRMPHRLVCYFLAQDVEEAVKVLEPWARRNDFMVEIICDGALKAFPRSVRELVNRLRDMTCAAVGSSRVRIRAGYGPREFVRAFAQAEMCITDSFHAVMFSATYNCNVRFLRPQAEWRKVMFARIEEFATTAVVGPFVCDGLSAALASLERGERVSFRQDVIQTRRAESIAWLRAALFASGTSHASQVSRTSFS